MEVKEKKLIEKIFFKHGKLDGKAFPEEQLFWFGYYHLMDISQQFMRKKSSMKIDHYIPGTRIPIKSDESLINKIDKIKIS